MTSRRSMMAAGAALLAQPWMTRAVRAEPPPTHFVVGFPPGGGGFDFVARQIAGKLPAQLGRQVIVENRAGASGRIALQYVANSRPDGEFVTLAPQGAMTLFPNMYMNLPFDVVKDFTPITRLVTYDFAVTVGPKAPVSTLAEFLEWVKQHPDTATFASPGNGTTPHFLGVAFFQKTGLPAIHVPYRGGAPAIQDLLAGEVAVQFDTVTSAIEYHRDHRLKMLAVIGPKRSPLAPEVPTLRECGVDLSISGWCGLYGPAGMSSELQASYGKAVAVAMQDESVKTNLSNIGFTPSPSTPGELAAQQREETKMWAPIVKLSGFKADS